MTAAGPWIAWSGIGSRLIAEAENSAVQNDWLNDYIARTIKEAMVNREELVEKLQRHNDRRAGPLPRTYWYRRDLTEKSRYGREPTDDLMRSPGERGANLIASKLSDGRHAPAIDLDLPCRLVPSSTPEHYHLYIEKAMTQEEYFKLLDVMAEVGIVETGYVEASKAQGMSLLRPEGQYKDDSAYEKAVRERHYWETKYEKAQRLAERAQARATAAEQRAAEAEQKAAQNAQDLTWF